MEPWREKHESIVRLVEALSDVWGDLSDKIVDHWEADLCAIGFAMATRPEVVVYVSTWRQPEGSFWVEIEGEGESLGRSSGTVMDGVELSELVGTRLGLRRGGGGSWR